jgi:hypothetical protein
MSGSAKKQFTLISEDPVDGPEPQEVSALAKANTQMLLLSLRALSKRALTAISNLFTLALVGSVWWVWTSILRDPTWQQLVAAGSYTAFCFLIDVVRRRTP